MSRFNIIVAMSSNRGIGINNKLPWTRKIMSEDMKWFRRATISQSADKINAVIMGSNTYKSIGSAGLKSRYNIVVSSNPTICSDSTNNNIKCVGSLAKALQKCKSNTNIDKIFVIGGEQLYTSAIADPRCENIYTTTIDKVYECDKFFPPIPPNYKLMTSEILDKGITLHMYKNMYNVYSQEQQYLDGLRTILETGVKTVDRTGVGTLSKFDLNLNFTIDCINPDASQLDQIYRIPLYTTKFVSLKCVVVELLWFLRGMTNVSWLKDRNVNIWNGHSSKEYLESIGLDYPEGIIGPAYGHQWVNWGGKYNPDGIPTPDSLTGINQVANVISMLKSNPSSRRAVISAYNVSDLDKMALVPCHLLYMFNVSGEYLNCKVVLRSNDMFLGNPFNVASTSILTILIAKAIGKLPGQVAVSISDAHIYLNHIEQVKEQIARVPYTFPLLTIDKVITSWEDMANLDYKNFILSDYNRWPVIKGAMAI